MKRLSIQQHGGSIRHVVSQFDLKQTWLPLGVLATCVACQASANDPSSKLKSSESVASRTDGTLVSATEASPKLLLSASEATKTSSPAEKLPSVKQDAVTKPLGSLTGKYRLTLSFGKDVQVSPKPGARSVGAQPDGSRVSFLEIMSRDGQIEKCVQSSLNGITVAQQPVCTGNSDEIKIVFADPKASFNATMEAVIRPEVDGIYKGPLLVRIVILPNGKQIGELSLSRL